MKTTILIDKKLSYAEDLEVFTSYLLYTFPLNTHDSLRVQVEKTNNKHLNARCGNGGFIPKDNKKFSIITLQVQKGCTREEALVALAHEYCHAMQQDRYNGICPTYGMTKKERQAGGTPKEVEADLFSIDVASAYLGLPTVTIVDTVGLGYFYKLSKAHENFPKSKTT